MEGNRRRLWYWWIGANGVGELVGLGLVFAAGILVAGHVGEPSDGIDSLLALALAVALGAAEGMIVGAAQWLVLRHHLPNMPPGAWIMATIFGAMAAWLLGMLPATLGAMQSAGDAVHPEPPESLVLVFAAGLGLVAGLVLSGAQAVTLRNRARGAGWWLLGNALAWALAMPWIFWLVGHTVAESVGLSQVVGFLLGLGLAGCLVGGVHGYFLIYRIRPEVSGASPVAPV